jgi:4-amino-4-deoxy-L-arabinose transferase-like glycosyltransferase
MTKERAALAVLLVAAAASRLARLTVLPGFLDETWYVSWALKLTTGMALVRPWLAGKGLPIYLDALVLPLAGGHALAASRAVTVAFSLLTVAAVFALARRLYDARTAVVAGAFYVFCPFALFHDRLFLADAVLTAFFAVALVKAFDFARSGRATDGALCGLALALGVLSKASGLLLLFVPVAAWVVLARPRRRSLAALASAMAVAVLLPAGPLWVFFRQTDAVRVAFGGGAPPIERLSRNVPMLGEWLWTWGTAPLCALAALALAAAAVRRHAPSLYLAAVSLAPLAALVLTATTWYPRYVHFVAVPALVLAARALVGIVDLALARARPTGLVRPTVLGAATLAALAPALANDWRLWTDPRRAPMPTVDRFQYVEGWPSGYGTRETVAAVQAVRARHPDGLTIVVRSREAPATPMALSVAFRRDSGVRIEDLPLDDAGRSLPLLERWARERPTVVVASLVAGGRRLPAGAWGRLRVEPLAETWKPDGRPCDVVYRVTALDE